MSIFDLSAYDFQNLMAGGLTAVPIQRRVGLDLKQAMHEWQVRNKCRPNSFQSIAQDVGKFNVGDLRIIDRHLRELIERYDPYRVDWVFGCVGRSAEQIGAICAACVWGGIKKCR